MIFSLEQQTLLFLEAVLLGMVSGLWYDVCRAVRQAGRLQTLGTALLDGVFCLPVCIGLFCFFVLEGPAQARGFVMLGAGLGAALYGLCFSAIVLPPMRWVLVLLGRAARFPWRLGERAAVQAVKLAEKWIHPARIFKIIKKKLSFLRRSG